MVPPESPRSTGTSSPRREDHSLEPPLTASSRARSRSRDDSDCSFDETDIEPGAMPSDLTSNHDTPYELSPALESRPLFTAARQPRSLKRDADGTRFVPDHAQETAVPKRFADDRRNRRHAASSAGDEDAPPGGAAPHRPRKQMDVDKG